MKVMVLGASGFVGTNVVPALVAAGVEVVAVSRSQSMNDAPGLHWITPDAPPQVGVDALISFAGVGTPASFETNPQAAIVTELSIADWVINLSQRHNIPQIVYLSTAGAIYGDGWNNGKRMVFAETSPCYPTSVYGQAKLASETRLREAIARKETHAQLCILRASNIYGPYYAKEGRQGLINTMISNAVSNQPVLVYGDGMVFRDYLFVDDLTNAVLAAVNSRAGGLFNIAMGCSHSILDIIDTVERIISVKVERIFQSARSFDIKYCEFCIDKAQRELYWKPCVTLEQGIAQVSLNMRVACGGE